MVKGVREKKNLNPFILVVFALAMGVFSSFPGSQALAQTVPKGMVQKEWKMPMGLSGHKSTDSRYPKKDVIIRVRHTDSGLGFGRMRLGGKIETAIIIDKTKTGGKDWGVTDRACTQILGPDGKIRGQRNWYIGGNGGWSVNAGYKTNLKQPGDVGVYKLPFWRNIFKNKKWGGRKFFTTHITVIGLNAAPPKGADRVEKKLGPTGIVFDVREAKLLPIANAVITETKTGLKAARPNDPKYKGVYVMDISPGSYELVAWAPCYIPQRIKVTVPTARPGVKNSGIAFVKIRMMPSFMRVPMRVLDQQGRPVRGAKINALNLPGKTPFLSTSTDAKGMTWMIFQESGPIPNQGGTVVFNVVRNNRVVATFQAFIRFAYCNNAGDTGALIPTPPAYVDTSKRPHVLVLPLSSHGQNQHGLVPKKPKGSQPPPEGPTGIVFDVREAKLLPIPNAVITETRTGLKASKLKNPKYKGVYAMKISSGSYEILAWAPCYIPQRKKVTVPTPRPGVKDSGIAFVKFRMMPSFLRVPLRVLDQQGRPVRGAKINALNKPGQKPFLSASTDAKGMTWMIFQESGPIPNRGGKVIFNVVRDNRVVSSFQAFIRFAYCNNAGDTGALVPSPPAYIDKSKRPHVLILSLSSPQNTRALQKKIIGKWNWFNGTVVDFQANGTVGGNPQLTWTVTDPIRRIIAMSWKGQTLKFALSPDGKRLEGKNRKGESVWGERVGKPAPAGSLASSSSMEQNTDRFGKDYDYFKLSLNDPRLCRDACRAQAACKAWTYVKPGRHGPEARCALKYSVPPPTPNDCCISGVK